MISHLLVFLCALIAAINNKSKEMPKVCPKCKSPYWNTKRKKTE